MSKLRCHISISADGFVAGRTRARRTRSARVVSGCTTGSFRWPPGARRMTRTAARSTPSSRIVDESRANIGAGVMGRNMFGPVDGGDWGDEQWKGWWGDNPPYHNDVFIVTHHPREPVAMDGGTTYHFVTDGIESALERAKEAAGGKDVMLWGGADVINQYLAAGLLDELELHMVPVLLGSGARLFDNLGGAGVGLEQVRTVEAPGVTHVKYRVTTG